MDDFLCKKKKYKHLVMIDYESGTKLIVFDKKRKAKKCFKKILALSVEPVSFITMKNGVVHIITRPSAPVEEVNINISNFWEDKIKKRGWNGNQYNKRSII